MINTQSGNVLFYILIAVAMLAALSYAVTKNSRGHLIVITDEQARLRATEIIEFSDIIANAVNQLRLRGCSETEISFDNPIDTAKYDNPFSPADGSCEVFSVAGGGIQYNNDFDLSYTGSYVITNVGSRATDIIIDLRTNRDICLQLNDLLDVSNSGVDGPPADKLSAGVDFQGDYTIAPTAPSNQRLVNADLIGNAAGCRVNSGTGTTAIFKYHKVVMAR